MKHPNATASLITGLLAAGVIKIADWLGYDGLTDEQALVIGGGAITVVLFLGKRIWTEGVRGLALSIWRGAKAVAVGSPPAS